jgi:CHAD domain-containing protein
VQPIFIETGFRKLDRTARWKDKLIDQSQFFTCMKNEKQSELQSAPRADQTSDQHLKLGDLKLGEYAHTVIDEQYRAIAKQEKKVLADKDPEHLHHMRVGTRRLRTALHVFSGVVELPKAAQEKRISSLAKVLGKLRDLDVQTADLQDNYRPALSKAEQSLLDEAIDGLQRERRKAFAGVEDALTRSRYRDLKVAYETWLDEPKYTLLAQLPLLPLLPDLLSPLLSTLLLHPGWLIEAADISAEGNEILHDLRKTCKHARYQAEFFKSFYGGDFQNWIGDIKAIQELLGKVHDSQVLEELLAKQLPKKSQLPGLQESIHCAQTETMKEWEPIRQRYLDPEFRSHLHQMLLSSTSAATGVNKSNKSTAN